MKKTLLALALLAGFAGTANASELSYSFIEANYIDAGDFDGGNAFSFDGWNLRGSVELGEHFYLLGEYNSVSDNPFGTSLNIDTYEVGAGFRTPISDKADFFADASYANLDFSCNLCSDDSENGYHVRLGVRAELGSKFEGTIGVTHGDFGDYGDNTGLLLGGHFKFTENFGLVANVEVGDETLYTVGVRASF